MEKNKRMLRVYSMLGMRGTFGTVLLELARENEKIFALTADLGNTSGLDRFADELPERYLNVGIAEQNMIGVAAGLADAGYYPFATTFANFACLRANEFMRHFMAYMKCRMCVVGLGAGYAMEYFGNTHYAVEDIAAIRAFPNLTIISPADGLELAKALEQIVREQKPTYLRLTGQMNLPMIYKEDFEYQIGKANWLRKADDPQVAIIVNGSVVHNALKAAEELELHGYRADVIDMHTIQPIDGELLDQIRDYHLIVTVEEHSCIGGLGSSVDEYYRSNHRLVRRLAIGTGKSYINAGSYDYMLQQMGLTAEQIADSILEELNVG